MPVYEYKCEKCGIQEDIRHTTYDSIKEKPCVCGGVMVKQLGTFSGFNLKGSGFFRNDYPKGK